MRGESRKVLRLKDAALDISAGTLVMGILNVTPDSFTDGGRFFGDTGRPAVDKAVAAALAMVEEGADIIDVGGESTRPGSARVPLQEELDRVLPVIEGIRRRSPVIISVDTYKSETARAASSAGAAIINDIGAGRLDQGMARAAAETGSAIILMHMQGTPETMQAAPGYGDVAAEVKAFLTERAEAAIMSGVRQDGILLDPGIGFGKTVAHNLALINRLDEIASLGYTVVLGVSRKAFIGKITGASDPLDRLEGGIAAAVIGIARGAGIIRAHDVKAAKRAALVADAVLRESDV